MVRGGLSKSCYTIHMNDHRPLQLSSKSKLGVLLPLRISPSCTIQTCLRNWIRATGRVGNMNYSSSSSPIRGHMGNSRHSSRINFKKICFRLLVLNVYDRFYPLRGLVAVTAIGVRHLNCVSMRDRNRLNVLGGRYEWFAFMDSIIVSHTIVCFLSLSPIHE